MEYDLQKTNFSAKRSYPRLNKNDDDDDIPYKNLLMHDIYCIHLKLN